MQGPGQVMCSLLLLGIDYSIQKQNGCHPPPSNCFAAWDSSLSSKQKRGRTYVLAFFVFDDVCDMGDVGYCPCGRCDQNAAQS